jgi:cell division protein ZapA (FtsZ GTPase activity inhibitor)
MHLNRRTLGRAGEAGVVGANLAITLAFALFAVIQLTRTTLAAQQIDDRVETITSDVGEIDEELVNVPKLDETVRIVDGIEAAAAPLTGQADQILTAARSIDGTVSSILANATSIGGTVVSIRGNLGALQPVVRSINDGVATINGQADRAIELVRGIKLDLDNVLAEVGSGGAAGHTLNGQKTISGHANSIDCSTAILNSQGCER